MTQPSQGASGATMGVASGRAPHTSGAEDRPTATTEAAEQQAAGAAEPPGTGAAERPAEKDAPGTTWPHHFLGLVGIERWIADDLPEPRAALARLSSMRDAVCVWTNELAAGAWPETIDHIDLQPSNAVVEEDGRVVIFDWEESLLTCPFFSIEQWMTRTRPRGEAARDAYLDALPWGTRGQRKRALELAVRLIEIKDYQMLEVIRDAEGFPGVFSWGPVQFIRRALKAWTEAA